MKIAIAHLRSTSPYSQSKPLLEKKTRNERDDDFEKRIWRKRCHVDDDGRIVIPGIQLKKSLEEAAQYKAIKIVGKGTSTYSKHFLAGVLVLENIVTPITLDTVEGEAVFCNADGKRGSGKRVVRIYPHIKKWEGKIAFTILDEIIDKDVFETHLRDAGQLVGIGRWRPRQAGGLYGRFEVLGIEWKNGEL